MLTKKTQAHAQVLAQALTINFHSSRRRLSLWHWLCAKWSGIRNFLIVIVEALVQDSPVVLINIYAPNKTCEAIDFYENLRSTLLESNYDQDYKFIMGDDFNVPLSLQLDSYMEVKQKKRDVVTKIRELMFDFHLVDIWRIRNPDKKRNTWKQNKPLVQRRLDYWLLTRMTWTTQV